MTLWPSLVEEKITRFMLTPPDLCFFPLPTYANVYILFEHVNAPQFSVLNESPHIQMLGYIKHCSEHGINGRKLDSYKVGASLQHIDSIVTEQSVPVIDTFKEAYQSAPKATQGVDALIQRLSKQTQHYATPGLVDLDIPEMYSLTDLNALITTSMHYQPFMVGVEYVRDDDVKEMLLITRGALNTDPTGIPVREPQLTHTMGSKNAQSLLKPLLNHKMHQADQIRKMQGYSYTLSD